ncbi:MAG: T9SS type A sorting domain-containing protein, partial [Bacteroidales bacterium]|nr:T9SS type A sorting domain-containing protein [Bacteroidales bacterium]
DGGVPGGSGQQNPVNIVYPAEGNYYVKLRTKNSFGNNTLQKDNYIVVGPVSVKEKVNKEGMIVYPNPTQGNVKIKILASPEAWALDDRVQVEVVNSSGNVIRAFNHDLSHHDLSVDLNDAPDGLYFIRVSGKDLMIQKKLSLIK